MRLLRAELRKLLRPLLYWTAAGVAVMSCLLVAQAHANYVLVHPRSQPLTLELRVPTCAELHLPIGSRCAEAQESAREANERSNREALMTSRLVRAGQQPLGVGWFASGLLASLVGAGALLLLAAGHVGGEWSGKTVKCLLVQDGRRGRLLLAKVESLWLAGCALLITTWAVLALAAPYFAARYGNPTVRVPVSFGAAAALAQTARALLVLATFAVLGVAAAVLTRNTLGTFFLGLGVVVLSLLLGQFAVTARWTLAYWITGWMGFAHYENIPGYLWSVRLPAGVPPPTTSFGLVALLMFSSAAAAVAWLASRRSDVTA